MESNSRIYLDHGATSFPKAPGVADAISNYITACGANINRGVYREASSVALNVLETRELLAALFHFTQDVRQVIFTPGVTYALNQVIRGWLHPGDHVLVSSLEHNAVMRPLQDLSASGVSFDRIPATREGITHPGSLLPLIKSNTRMVIVSHASNVCGAIFPLKETAQICKDHGIPLVVDAAQSAGHLSIDFAELDLAALCVPAHKGLLGPQGVGAMLLRKDFAEHLQPLITGGTGSASYSERQPDYLPDKFESGTMNLPGILGWNAALHYVLENGITHFRQHEMMLTHRFLEGVKRLPSFTAVGPCDPVRQVGVVSLVPLGMDAAQLSFDLENEYGILTRPGLHCAPNAHKTLGTFPQGTIRFSFGYKTTPAEIDITLAALTKLIASS